MTLLRIAALAALCVLGLPAVAQDVPTVTPPASLEDLLSPYTTDRVFKESKVAMQIVDVRTGEEVFGRDADRALIPASTMKVVTSAAALRSLGPSFKFSTDIYVDGPIDRGVLRGNLYVKGHGDPTLVVEKMWKLIKDLEMEGVERIEGDVIYDASYFDDRWILPGWDKEEDLEEGPSYFARMSALSVNFNTVSLIVGPGEEVGAEGFMTLETPAEGHVVIENHVVTTSATSWPRIDVQREVTGETLTFTVEGTMPLGTERKRFYRTVEDPTAHFIAVFSGMMTAEGIRVSGKHRRDVVSPDARLLISLQSPSLAAILMDMNKYSNNFIAESVLRAMGAEVAGAPGTTEKGLAVVAEYLNGIGVDPGGYVLVNGSGLARGTRVPPSLLTAVMVDMAADPRVGHEFIASLAIAGMDGTLYSRMPDDPGRLRGKTGTIDGVHCLTGYLEAGDGRLYAFAFLVNDIRGDMSKVKSLQDRFAAQVLDLGADDAPEVVDRGD